MKNVGHFTHLLSCSMWMWLSRRQSCSLPSEVSNNSLLARPHHRWLPWASCSARPQNHWSPFAIFKISISLGHALSVYFLEHGSREGSYCTAWAEALCTEKWNKETISNSQDAPLSWREMLTSDLNSIILFHGLSRDVFSNLLQKKQFSSQPKGVFPCDTLLGDEAFLWGTEINTQMTHSWEKYTEIDL